MAASNALATIAIAAAEETRRRLHTTSPASHICWLWQSRVVATSNVSAVAVATAVVAIAAA